MGVIFICFDTNNRDDMEDFEVWRKGSDYQAVLSELDEYLRSKLKYEELDEQTEAAHRETRDKLHNLLEERNVALW